MSDNVAFENTIRGSTVLDYQSVSTKQTIVPIADSNNGGYQGNIRFNITSLQNQFINWAEAVLEVPVTIQCKGVSQTQALNQWVLGIKNGSLQLIDSMEFKLNNKQIVDPQSYSNFYNIYKAMSSWSQDTLDKVGPSVGVSPDSAGSVSWGTQATPIANGPGFSNNVNIASTLDFTAANPSPELYNLGFYRRQQFINSYASIGYNGMAATTSKLTPGIKASQLVSCNKSNFVATTGSSGNGFLIGTWNLTFSIRLIDLHDVFGKLPFSNYGQIEMTLWYNQFNPAITSVAAASTTQGTLAWTTVGQQFGNTCPFMIASAAATYTGSAVLTVGTANGGTLLVNTADLKTFTMTIGNAGNITGANPNLTQCLLYIPTYDLDARYVKELIDMRPFSDVRYDRLLQNNTTGILPGNSFTFNVTPGQANLKSLVCIPMYSTNNTGQTNQDFQSPFSSCPGTTCPLASITQFNVTVNNKPVFPSNVNYEFDMFLNQVQRINALNSSESDSINSGLISEFMWTNAYRYYVADLNRQDIDSFSSPKSVNVIGYNNSNVILDLYCFLVYEDHFKLYTQTGAVEA